MHEHSLFASIPAGQHHDLLQQLAGITAMQPNHIYERHLIFKPHRKPGFIKPRPGGSQDVQAHEAQRLNKLLSGSLYYIKVVGEVTAADFGAGSGAATAGRDVTMGGTVDTGAATGDQMRQRQYDVSNQSWKLEFKDIPDAGTGSAVTSRLISTSKIPYGDIVPIMRAWGYEYVKTSSSCAQTPPELI